VMTTLRMSLHYATVSPTTYVAISSVSQLTVFLCSWREQRSSAVTQRHFDSIHSQGNCSPISMSGSHPSCTGMLLTLYSCGFTLYTNSLLASTVTIGPARPFLAEKFPTCDHAN
jgi:hypothetical protein